MSDARSDPVLQLIRRAFDDPRLRDCPDAELLRRFAARRDAAAFGAILRRHGPMVLDVCRGLLAADADAEDAFQATFLVLARKAGSVRKAGSLASWLQGVAVRTARKAQAEFARRRKHEPHVRERSATARPDDLTWAEVRRVLHEELNSLPDRLRGPLVLCYLEGMTQDQAAAELGLPKGTLKGRLERGRAALRARLVRRGLGPAAALLASAWPVADVSASLADATVRAATGLGRAVTGLVPTNVDVLAAEVLRTMSLSRLRAAALLAVAAGFCAGVGAFALHPPAGPAKGQGREVAEHASRTATRPDAPQQKLEWQEGPATIRKQSGPAQALAFAPDGKTIAAAVTKTLLNGEVKGEVAVYDLTNGKELTVLAGFHPVAFSPDGKALAARDGDNVVRVWEVDRWAPRTALKGLSDTVLCLAFSTDGKYLAAGSGDPSKSDTPGMVRLWDLESGTERATHTHPGAVYAVSFAADGKTLFSASAPAETIVKSWDIIGRRELVEIKGPGPLFGSAFAFSPDGKTVATAMNHTGYSTHMDVKVWDRTTGKDSIKPLHHPEWVQTLEFSRDGKTLATGGRAKVGERTVGETRLWDVATGNEVAVLQGQHDRVRCLAFDRNGKVLATGSEDGTVTLWLLGESVDVNDDLWVKSEDGALALRVSAFVKAAAPGEPIELVARLRNLSDRPVNVLRPFGVPAVAVFGVEVRGKDGKLPLRADPPIYQVPPEAFARLKPGESVRESWKLDPRQFAGLESPGRYTITVTYAYKGLWDEFAERGGLTRVWRGTIAGKGVPIEIRDAKARGATEPVRDERVEGFVAHLARNGIKLTPTGDPSIWRVVEPNVAEGEVIVRIVAFPPAASREQVKALRDKLGDLPTVEKRDERMAVTGLRVRGADGTEVAPATPETRRLESRVLDQFRLYDPAQSGTGDGK